MGQLAASVEVVRHEAFTPALTDELRSLFDAEYLSDFGEWDPKQPYGYASHDIHLVARAAGDIVGHAGWARRTIMVGSSTIEVAGTGGVLVAAEARGLRVGEQIMHAARRAMLDAPDIQFGYLGCRENVAHFYRACGWQRISAVERSVSHDGHLVEDPAGQPLFILPLRPSAGDWPDGVVDIQGRPW